ncbi:nuclear protein MDM1 isoform X2 [Siniperca chuatsi]|uniref:nuclear protein MDM1 isoform X2 n=1 Tax=Siniperca chuatsi TaxID=119488 RepID=UPI001CE14327|nr:nuclear protein MDM1 isoform X2 [Siniperca chuatsi]
MTVRFKCRSEYQKSYRVSRSRSVSPQRCAPLAGLRSDQMGISREPGLQRRKRPGPAGLAQSCSSLLCPPDPQHSLAHLTPHAHRTAHPAASRSRSAHRKEPQPPTPPGPADPEPPAGPRPAADPRPPASPRPAADPRPPAGPRPAADPRPPASPRPAADPGPPAGPRPAADPGPPAGPRPAANPGPSVEPGAAGKSAKPHPSKPDSQPQLSQPLKAAPDGQQPSTNEVQHALRWRAGLRSGGQRSGAHRSEYHRQFSWKKPATAASPILTAEQALHSSSRSVPPFKKNLVSMETEYQRSFQGLVPPTKPRLRKHLEHQRVPLFHTHVTNKKRREESEKKPRPKRDAPAPQKEDVTPPPPPQVQRGHRIPEGGGATDGDAPQVKELRQKALSYRRRAWGANFSRDHLSQLVSEHNALWEPTDTTGSATDPPTPRLTFDLCRDPGSRSSSCVEALDLASRSSDSSKRSSVPGSGEIHRTNKNTQIKAPPSPPAERRKAWGEEEDEEEEEEENTNEEEGRLPTPRLKMLPVQRTHHDLTTPVTGGAILVGKLKSSDESSPYKQQRGGSAVSMAAGAETALDVPVQRMEAWPENNSPHRSSSGSSPDDKPAASPPSKPIRTKQTPPSPVAPPPLVPPPPHCIQGTLRHPDFQHNGELGLRFRELQCSGGGCGSDEDDRLSVMSWRSAASCSMASTVLERAQKRREDFWGKR